MTALVLTAVILTLLAVVLARLRRRLDEAELTLRTLAGEVRTLRRTVESVAPLAGEVVRDTAAGEVSLERLEALKRGGHRRRSGTFGDGDGVGPVSLPLRPSPNRVPSRKRR